MVEKNDKLEALKIILSYNKLGYIFDTTYAKNSSQPEGPPLHSPLSFSDALYLGTRGSALATRLDHKVGSLEVGLRYVLMICNVPIVDNATRSEKKGCHFHIQIQI